MFDIKQVKAEAEKEINDEKIAAAKTKLKSKLREQDNARKILANLTREVEDLVNELGQQFS